ncbi:MAG: hypothetical protein ACK4QW_10520 [Alphaproteobacteria bacterium]
MTDLPSDEALLDLVQRQTLRCFWDLAHPVSELARDRSDIHPLYGPDAVTTGGSGFMSCPEVKTGLRRLGFESPHLAGPD